MTKLKRWAVLAATTLLLAACATNRQAFDDGRDMIRAGRTEQGLALLEQSIRENPRNAEFRTYYLQQREAYFAELLAQADAARAARRHDEAERGYVRVSGLDANNPRAVEGIAGVRRERRHDEMAANADGLAKAGKADEARAVARAILAENPGHEAARKLVQELDAKATPQADTNGAIGAAFRKPITLEFRDASLAAIFDVIAHATQLNFILDRDVRADLRSTINVRNTTIEEVVNLLLVTNQLEKRVLNQNTLLIYPNTPAKARDYQELVVRAFHLANADVKQTMNMIRTLVKTKDIFIDEKLNLLLMKDTPEAVRLAEKLIATQDHAEPEVMLEVEVLEVKRSRLLDLGIQFPNTFTALNIANQVTQSTTGGVVVSSTAQAQNIVTVQTLRSLTGANVAVSPTLGVNVRKEDGDAQILANPRIRVKNREKAKIHIGEKVPVITTTSTANVGVAESVNYLDVGLKLDVEPQVYLDKEVGIKVGLEVSGIVREIRGQSGTLTYQVGTRNATTALRLKDGETQILAGLISDEDRQSASKVPGLGDLPVIGRLFSTHRDETTKTEIILLITPRIVRNVMRLDARASEFGSGTEGAVGASALTLREPPAPELKLAPAIGAAPPAPAKTTTPP